MLVSLSVHPSPFVCPPGNKHFLHTGEGGGTNISKTQEVGDKHFYIKGDTNIFTSKGGDKHFLLEAVVHMMMLIKRWL